ncbi:glycosyltransferase family 1 protein [Exiguobacterium aestuarii]|uniref:glycosyltransferase family 1 protein n=1 Tax=Exiguobacterium aestuarii TaxID=273527 RepID=UPI001CD3FCFB|nr:glycosyltransferase family 1 protein [Exiguobacterium aestuarii]MCA0981205.1 glycosyltransferase family 1 protein [Exiguobacterium aestuarii]
MERKLRVLHYVPGFDQGGIESRLLDWYRNIDRNKIQFDLIKLTPDRNNDLIEEFKLLGGNVYTLPKFSPKNFLSFRKELRYMFKSNDSYDVVHCHSPATGYFFLKEAKKNNVPVRILHSRTTQFNSESTFIFVRHQLKKLANNYATSYFSCSNEAAVWQFGEEALLNQNVTIINNGIESYKFKFNYNTRIKILSELELDNCFVVGHVGRFATAKNHLFLIDVFNEITKKQKNARLVLIGSGLTKKEIEEKVNKLNLSDKVIFLGEKNNVEDYFQAMDVFLFPSHYEGFGTVAIEAQAAGLKCIVSEGVPNTVDVTDLIEHLPLEAGPMFWANKVLEYSRPYERRDTYEEIVNAGFDAITTVKYLSEFYNKN